MAALEALSLDLRGVREEYDRVAAEYRRAMSHLEERVQRASPGDVLRDAQQIGEVAEGLRRAALRLESSFRETKELEEELRDWESRAGEQGVRNIDHPDVRAEILRSELALRRDRGVLRSIPREQSPFYAMASLDGVQSVVNEPDDAADDAEEIGQGLYPSAEQLLITIRQTSKDIEGWHEQADVSDEACDDVRRLRELHAALRRIDHQEGMARDRVAYALRMR